MKPNVMILIATKIIGGPGKGLFQLLKESGNELFEYRLCNFQPRYKKNLSNDFYNYAERAGIIVEYLRQDMVIDPILVLRSLSLVRKWGCNVIQTHGYKSNILGFFLKMIMGTPWIGFAHGYTSDNKKMKVYNWIDQHVLRFADRVVAVSERMKFLLTEKGVHKKKVKVIKNAVDPSEIKATASLSRIRRDIGINEGDSVIGVVGRLNPEKGHIVFLEAMKMVVESLPSCKALIVGEGQERKRLEQFCRENGIDSKVRLLGHKLSIGNYYQLMDLVVIPSFSEGLPNVLLEAMILGIPVVATNVGGIPEVLNDENGVIIPPGNADFMRKEIVDILRDEKRCRRISENAKTTAMTSFRPEVRANKIIQLYYEVLNNHTEPL